MLLLLHLDHRPIEKGRWAQLLLNALSVVTLNNASDYRANGLLSDYIGWTNGLTD